MSKKDKFEIFENPGGFIEHHFIGIQTPDSVISAIEALVKKAKKHGRGRKSILILVDVTKVPKIDISGKMAGARKEAVEAMKDARYDRIAVYGDVAVQVMVNTLVLIAGKRDKIRVFGDRVDALRWLKG